MANPFVKFWKYLMAAFSSKIDEHADPKVQIQQAIEEAQRAHQALSQQAAAVIGNQRQRSSKATPQICSMPTATASGMERHAPTKPTTARPSPAASAPPCAMPSSSEG